MIDHRMLHRVLVFRIMRRGSGLRDLHAALIRRKLHPSGAFALFATRE